MEQYPGSQILDCVSFNKSALTGVWKIRIGVFVQCVGTTCDASATVENASTLALLGDTSHRHVLGHLARFAESERTDPRVRRFWRR